MVTSGFPSPLEPPPVLPPLIVAKSDVNSGLLPGMANRHGLIAGATGTGKTVTLQALAEHLSGIGVPVFMADVKGDLGGLAAPGGGNAKVAERVKQLGIADHVPTAYPVAFWDVFGDQGHPVRATISEMGPLLLGRVLNLNETQAGVLAAVFKIADDNGLLLLDLKDLRSLLQFAGDNAAKFRTQYGNISTASVGAIQRGLLKLSARVCSFEDIGVNLRHKVFNLSLALHPDTANLFQLIDRDQFDHLGALLLICVANQSLGS